MQTELQTDHPDLNISILSINLKGAEAGVDVFTEEHALPMVQDTELSAIWLNWGELCTIEEHDAESKHWRDLFILNKQNQVLKVYNLTLNNLGTPENYEELKQKFIQAASE